MSGYKDPHDGNSPDYPSWNWKEGDWQKFLVISDIQIRQFIAYYHLLLDDPMRLDKVAEQMGWMNPDWSNTEDPSDSDMLDSAAEEEPSAEEELPYTLHLHPIYIVTRGIFRSLNELAMAYAKLNNQNTLFASGHP
jgi:hypothetical protein